MTATSFTEQQYNWTDPLHVPPFKNEYVSRISTQNLTTELIKMTVGKDGKFFKELTEENNMCYIWHNITENMIEIWGNESKHDYIKQQIIEKIQEIDLYLKSQNRQGII
jgi:polyribonucleotide nucleotidyltransferase|tara:strand:+ start:1557 stop:1883 length:327 start_codon:yes stop_codon:yes gene_type:complete